MDKFEVDKTGNNSEIKRNWGKRDYKFDWMRDMQKNQYGTKLRYEQMKHDQKMRKNWTVFQMRFAPVSSKRLPMKIR